MRQGREDDGCHRVVDAAGDGGVRCGKGLALSGGREGAVGWNEGRMPWLHSSLVGRGCVVWCEGLKTDRQKSFLTWRHLATLGNTWQCFQRLGNIAM
jgi:hypothetical protein